MMRPALRALKWTALALLLLVLVLAAWIGVQAWPAIFPSSDHDTVAPAVPASFSHPAVLVFSKTNGFRHGDAIEASQPMFRELAAKQGWSLFATENGAIFTPELLSRFQVVVWNNASGDLLSNQQRAALKAWIEQGGGFVGIHAAGDNSHEAWRWYTDEVIGAHFVGHTIWPHLPSATVHVEDRTDPVTAGLPAVWPRADEWYSFDRSVRAKGFRILATVDEASYERGGLGSSGLSMGRDHPIVWSHCLGKGRVVYSALGHTAESYFEAPFRALVSNAVTWAMRREPCDATSHE